jgi:hypothetical protein
MAKFNLVNWLSCGKLERQATLNSEARKAVLLEAKRMESEYIKNLEMGFNKTPPTVLYKYFKICIFA